MSGNLDPSGYAVDLVFCIDCTYSMRPYLDSVKQTAVEFHDLLLKKMGEKQKRASRVRVRVVAFRDLGHDGAGAMDETPFFELPEESGRFSDYVHTLEPTGGGDIPESALEALALAIRSPWAMDGFKSRQVIVLCTDAPAHPLGKHAMPGRTDMPAELADLKDMWGDGQFPGELDARSKRLVLFAPDDDPWNEIGEEWEQVIWFPSKAKEGMRDHEQAEILEQIAGSI